MSAIIIMGLALLYWMTLIAFDAMDSIPEVKEFEYKIIRNELNPIRFRVDRMISPYVIDTISRGELEHIFSQMRAELVNGLDEHITVTDDLAYDGSRLLSAEIVIAK
jgi:hypothetical protein